jgi:CubicO group peptidase (beta-lactamase class C family)
MRLDAALDRFWEAADVRRLGVDAVQVVVDDGPAGERRRIADIRRDVFSVSKTVTSLAVGMLEGDGALTLDDPVLAHLPRLADTAAAGSEMITVGHLLRMTQAMATAGYLRRSSPGSRRLHRPHDRGHDGHGPRRAGQFGIVLPGAPCVREHRGALPGTDHAHP